MDLTLAAEEEQLVASLGSLLQQESSFDRVRAAEASGFDSDLWRRLQALGIPSMAVADQGTPPATLFQLALVAEQAGTALASAPVIEAIVATRLLDRFGVEASELVHRIRVGELIPTLSLRSPAASAPRIVPAGAIAQLVVGLDDEKLVAVISDPPRQVVANLGSLAIAYRDLESGSRTVLGTGAAALDAFATACRDWKALSAAQLVGVSGAALALAIEYVKSREVFGAPIATFQTISHRLADDATAVDGARLLAYKAAWAADEMRDNADALASMAWCFASETALGVTRDSLHYHGGYGFTREYDIQLYFRRAKAYSLLWADPRVEYQRLADALFPKEP